MPNLEGSVREKKPKEVQLWEECMLLEVPVAPQRTIETASAQKYPLSHLLPLHMKLVMMPGVRMQIESAKWNPEEDMEIAEMIAILVEMTAILALETIER